MSRNHRNRTVLVLPPHGALLNVCIRVTPEKAERFVEQRIASWVDGYIGSRLQLIGSAPNRPATVETAALAVKLGLGDNERMSDVASYVASRSPHRWAQRPRITQRKQGR